MAENQLLTRSRLPHPSLLIWVSSLSFPPLPCSFLPILLFLLPVNFPTSSPPPPAHPLFWFHFVFCSPVSVSFWRFFGCLSSSPLRVSSTTSGSSSCVSFLGSFSREEIGAPPPHANYISFYPGTPSLPALLCIFKSDGVRAMKCHHLYSLSSCHGPSSVSQKLLSAHCAESSIHHGSLYLLLWSILQLPLSVDLLLFPVFHLPLSSSTTDSLFAIQHLVQDCL